MLILFSKMIHYIYTMAVALQVAEVYKVHRDKKDKQVLQEELVRLGIRDRKDKQE